MIRFLFWIGLACVISVGTGYAVTVAYVFGYEHSTTLPKADAIVVLAGNVSRNGQLYGSTALRTEKGIALYKAGVAPLIVMTGGGVPKMGDDMAAEAIRQGVPAADILIENRSESTLQNALFTADLPEMDPDMSLVIVSNRYHLLRSWTSFRWAGFTEVTRYAVDPELTYRWDHSGIKKEAFKWPANALRAVVASAAMGLGVPRRSYEWILQ